MAAILPKEHQASTDVVILHGNQLLDVGYHLLPIGTDWKLRLQWKPGFHNQPKGELVFGPAKAGRTESISSQRFNAGASDSCTWQGTIWLQMAMLSAYVSQQLLLFQSHQLSMKMPFRIS